MVMDKEALAHQEARLYRSSLDGWRKESTVLNTGALIYSHGGRFTLLVNFQPWQMQKDYVMILFPGDVVQVSDAPETPDVEVLEYDASLLREASVQLEHTVYSQLRADRCRGDDPLVSQIVGRMMDLLRVFFGIKDCTCLPGMVLLQLKAFFLGFYDFLQRRPGETPRETESHRTVALFSAFMELLSQNYRESRDVAFYASRMNISAKYLGTIVRRMSGHTCKAIIDHYIVMQLKTQLRSSRQSIKEIAWQYHFTDESFFCHYFKQHTGTTPQQYRRIM